MILAYHIGVQRSLRNVLFCVACRASVLIKLTLIPQLKAKLYNAETKKPFHEFSFKHAVDSFLEIASCLFLPHLSTLTVRNEFTARASFKHMLEIH